MVQKPSQHLMSDELTTVHKRAYGIATYTCVRVHTNISIYTSHMVKFQSEAYTIHMRKYTYQRKHIHIIYGERPT